MRIVEMLGWTSLVVILLTCVTIWANGEKWVDSKMLSARNKRETVEKVILILAGMAALGFLAGAALVCWQ